MVRIKICGIKSLEEIHMMNELMPDYIGFVFAESKRKVSLLQAQLLSRALSKEIKKVGVFVKEDLSFIKEAAQIADLQVVQLHGENSFQYDINFAEVWRAVRINRREDMKSLDLRKEALLLDSKVEGQIGGSGISFDWNIARDIGRNLKIILAGGLKEHNVKEAIEIIKPYAVDVSSGVETNGVKDFEKCKNFIRKVRGL